MRNQAYVCREILYDYPQKYPLVLGGGGGVPFPARKHANVFRSAFWEG